mmetsp:Transcript_17474/g.25976  ORF Transcript_17474/g.25976 Transcript_17474/m.25976 type:complete len:96 (+) Transcript_17474:1-288(+)
MCKLHRRKTSSAHHQRHHDQHVKVIDEEAVRGWKMGWNELQNIICILQCTSMKDTLLSVFRSLQHNCFILSEVKFGDTLEIIEPSYSQNVTLFRI